jgi:hypothetical protein
MWGRNLRPNPKIFFNTHSNLGLLFLTDVPEYHFFFNNFNMLQMISHGRSSSSPWHPPWIMNLSQEVENALSFEFRKYRSHDNDRSHTHPSLFSHCSMKKSLLRKAEWLAMKLQSHKNWMNFPCPSFFSAFVGLDPEIVPSFQTLLDIPNINPPLKDRFYSSQKFSQSPNLIITINGPKLIESVRSISGYYLPAYNKSSQSSQIMMTIFRRGLCQI